MKLLVTTALEETWGEKESIVFLGDWCRLYERRDVWDKRKHETVPNHWDDRSKLQKNHDYLKELHEVLLEELACNLNSYHQIERPTSYWRMILDPWLVSYVAVIFDRWEYLRLAFEEYGELETIAIELNEYLNQAFDTNNFQKLTQSDQWNHQLFLEIIQSEYQGRCIVSKKVRSMNLDAENEALEPLSISRLHTLKKTIFKCLDTLLSKISKRNIIVFHESYFPYISLVKLNIHFGQLPRLYLREFEWPQHLVDFQSSIVQKSNRVFNKLHSADSNSFEKFISNRIIKDIPYVYIEGFQKLQSNAEAISVKPKVILSANSHWYNEVFKIWSAEQIFKGASFIAMQHGGSINLGALSVFDFEEDISDYYATWGITTHPKHIRLPASKIMSNKPLSGGKYCSLIGLEMPRYAFRAQINPISGQVLEHLGQAIELYNDLSPQIQNNFRIKPYPEQGWNFRQRFVDTIGVDKVYEHTSYEQVLLRSRFIITTYPETTFAEAMISGVPTILLYPDKFWELHPKFHSLLDILRKTHIVFHDPKAAANHINDIWNEPLVWWDSPDVISARSDFIRQTIGGEVDHIKKWVNFIEGIIK